MCKAASSTDHHFDRTCNTSMDKEMSRKLPLVVAAARLLVLQCPCPDVSHL